MVHPITNGFLRNAQPKFGLGGMGLAGLPNPKGNLMDKYYPSGMEDLTTSTSKIGKESKKNSIALSALTLLAFLFFLNILQSCLQENNHEYKHKVHYPNVPSVPSFSGQLQLQPLPQLPVISVAGQFGREADVMENREVPEGENSLEVDVKINDKMLESVAGLEERKLDSKAN